MMDGVQILDKWGRERTAEELADVYGDIEITPCKAGGSCWRVEALIERACLHAGFPMPTDLGEEEALRALDIGPVKAGLIGTEVRINGFVLPEIEIALFRSGGGAPAICKTSDGGAAHFAISDVYDPAAGETGPYSVAIANMPSDRVDGLGILAGEQPAHLDVVFTWSDVRSNADVLSALGDLVRANRLFVEGSELVKSAKRKLEVVANGG